MCETWHSLSSHPNSHWRLFSLLSVSLPACCPLGAQTISCNERQAMMQPLGGIHMGAEYKWICASLMRFGLTGIFFCSSAADFIGARIAFWVPNLSSYVGNFTERDKIWLRRFIVLWMDGPCLLWIGAGRQRDGKTISKKCFCVTWSRLTLSRGGWKNCREAYVQYLID